MPPSPSIQGDEGVFCVWLTVIWPFLDCDSRNKKIKSVIHEFHPPVDFEDHSFHEKKIIFHENSYHMQTPCMHGGFSSIIVFSVFINL